MSQEFGKVWSNRRVKSQAWEQDYDFASQHEELNNFQFCAPTWAVVCSLFLYSASLFSLLFLFRPLCDCSLPKYPNFLRGKIRLDFKALSFVFRQGLHNVPALMLLSSLQASSPWVRCSFHTITWVKHGIWMIRTWSPTPHVPRRSEHETVHLRRSCGLARTCILIEPDN